MKRLALTLIVSFLALGVHIPTASAHSPEYIDAATRIQIPDAGTSRAYYGELTGAPAVYTVTSDKEFSLYLNILSPYVPDAKKDFTVHITNGAGVLIATVAAPSSEWQQWYEEFAGDSYWKGPEFKQTVPAGTYTIEVSNPGNTGKYVLAPGEAEVFTLAGTPRTINQIYLVKTRFFGKPWYSVFEGIIGKSMLGLVAAILLVVAVIITLLYRRSQARTLP